MFNENLLHRDGLTHSKWNQKRDKEKVSAVCLRQVKSSRAPNKYTYFMYNFIHCDAQITEKKKEKNQCAAWVNRHQCVVNRTKWTNVKCESSSGREIVCYLQKSAIQKRFNRTVNTQTHARIYHKPVEGRKAKKKTPKCEWWKMSCSGKPQNCTKMRFQIEKRR